MTKPVFCLMGPTASGKSALSLELAAEFPFEIISVDSAMVYREMDIGTAKPSLTELASVPHHFIDILDPPESFSAALFCEKANRCIAEIFQRNKFPLLVGGTMMYFHALQQGLSNLPEANPEIREALGKREVQSLHAELVSLDAAAASKIKTTDSQRLQRALEIIYTTGETLTSIQSKEKTKSPYSFITTQLIPEDRALLHQTIANRFHHMLEKGFIAEVENLLKKWQLPPNCPSMRAVGYRQAAAYLEGQLNYPLFVEKAIIASRQLAKRQLTWLRNWQTQVDLRGDAKAIFDFIAMRGLSLGGS